MARKQTLVPAAAADSFAAALDGCAEAHDAKVAAKAARKSAVPDAYKRKYQQSALKGTCDDEFAQAFADAAPKGSPSQREELAAIGRANGIDTEERWGQRNLGMVRMNLSNVLRQRAKKGQAVVIGGWTNQPVAAAA